VSDLTSGKHTSRTCGRFAIEPLFAVLMVSWPATFTCIFEGIESLGVDPSLFL
jgi:hypothetical protein